MTMNQVLTAGEHRTKGATVKGAVVAETVLKEEILIKILQETAVSVIRKQAAGKQVREVQIG